MGIFFRKKSLAPIVAILLVHIVFFAARESIFLKWTEFSRESRAPAGVLFQNKNVFVYRDFNLHCEFVRRILQKVTPRPYTQEGQKAIFKNWIPFAVKGMPHPYSPTVVLLLWPFLFLDAWTAFYLFALVNLVALLMLWQRYLLPRTKNGWEVAAVTIVGISMSVVHTIGVGQVAILTMGGLAAIWHLLYEPKTRSYKKLSGGADLILGLLLFALSAKPQMALVAGMILLGARRWRAVLLGVVLFLSNFVMLSPYYGDWPTALVDYQNFVRHYYKEAMDPFFQTCFNYDSASDIPGLLAMTFGISDHASASVVQALNIFVAIGALGLCLSGKIGPSAHFRLQLINLLLLSPYLRTSEDLLFALLIVEGAYFGTQRKWVEWIKLGLLVVLVNMDPYFNYGLNHYPVKLLLFVAMASSCGKATARD